MLEENKKKNLGRGLGALLGGEDLDLDVLSDKPGRNEAGKEAKTGDRVDIDKLVPGKYQPRTEFDKAALDSLVESIKEKGVLQPLLVRKQGDKYEIIAGERRWRASKEAGLKEVPVIVKDFSDKEALEVALIENLLRENLSAIEEAEGYKRLMDEFSHTQEALAQVVGKSRSQIANTLRLLSLPAEVQEMVKENKISAGHARALVGLDNAVALAKQIIAKDLNVRQVEDLVSKQKEPKKAKNPRPIDEDIEEIENDLRKELGLRIKITPSKQGGGKVTLQYASAAELDMILSILENKNKQNTNNSVNTVFKNTNSEASNQKFSINVID